MDVEIELGDPVVVRVTDAIHLARDAALDLNRELRPTDAD